jgi:exonuclease VII small subunit
MRRGRVALEEAIETLQRLELVRRRIRKLEKHLQIAQLHVRMIETELGFEQKRRRTASMVRVRS